MLLDLLLSLGGVVLLLASFLLLIEAVGDCFLLAAAPDEVLLGLVTNFLLGLVLVDVLGLVLVDVLGLVLVDDLGLVLVEALELVMEEALAGVVTLLLDAAPDLE